MLACEKAILSSVIESETRRNSVADNLKSQVAVAKPASHAKNDIEKDKFILKQLVTKDFKIKYRLCHRYDYRTGYFDRR